jgi:hypothetical protein
MHAEFVIFPSLRLYSQGGPGSSYMDWDGEGPLESDAELGRKDA